MLERVFALLRETFIRWRVHEQLPAVFANPGIMSELAAFVLFFHGKGLDAEMKTLPLVQDTETWVASVCVNGMSQYYKALNEAHQKALAAGEFTVGSEAESEFLEKITHAWSAYQLVENVFRERYLS